MFQLSETDQRLLLRIARDAVSTHLTNSPAMTTEICTGVLTERRGVFVSIQKGRTLRGCIGNIYPSVPLYQSTRKCAVSAAFEDPRFEPLTRAGLREVTFEISVLSAMEPVKSIEEIIVGTDGLHICKGESRGLLLPQVASIYGWDRERFLIETCRKAGLKHDAWKEGSKIYRFKALVFAEHNFELASTS